ncbi:MAG: dihydroorotase [Thermodesulfobacteriota bacterium]
MRIRIKGGRLLDPGHIDSRGDVDIVDGKIIGIYPDTNGTPKDASAVTADIEIDATGCIVAPGLMDMHVHLRQPGFEYKETIETGICAAAAGGFTAVCCMPNTDPVNDNAQITNFILDTAAKCRSARVYPIGAISVGLEGQHLAAYGEMKAAGAVGVSDDGRPVSDAQLMRRALEYANGMDMAVISHCEDTGLAGGDMNEGVNATRLGLAGIPNAAESIMVLRDIAVCELTGIPVHIAHVSTRQSVDAIRTAKQNGLPVTAETAPHYFTLTDDAVAAYDTHAKMNPPLRSSADREAIRQALADGTIDVIATDHAPHDALVKNVEFDRAANGIIGLETALPLCLDIVRQGYMSLSALIEKMAKAPARIIGKTCGLAVDAPADITVIDPDCRFDYHAERGCSKSCNSPFDGWQMTGRAIYTIVNGRVVFDAKTNSPRQ